jgi:hypothetical protein
VITSCLIFSTQLVPEPAPKLEDWWYYGLEHGQHIAFYTRKSLEVLAQQFGYEFATDGAQLHVFSLNHNQSHQFRLLGKAGEQAQSKLGFIDHAGS